MPCQLDARQLNECALMTEFWVGANNWFLPLSY